MNAVKHKSWHFIQIMMTIRSAKYVIVGQDNREAIEMGDENSIAVYDMMAEEVSSSHLPPFTRHT